MSNIPDIPGDIDVTSPAFLQTLNDRLRRAGGAAAPGKTIAGGRAGAPSVPVPVPVAPDVRNFQAGHLVDTTYEPYFYWDETGTKMLVDLVADAPSSPVNFGGVQFVVTYPDGNGGTVTEAISERLVYAPGTADHTFQPGATYTLAVSGSIPATPETWTIGARSFNADDPPTVNASGPHVDLTTVAPADAGPPQPGSSDWSIGAPLYQHNDQTGENIAQIPITITSRDPSITKYYIWQYIDSGGGAPTDPSQFTNAAAVAQADAGNTTVLYNVTRNKTASLTLYVQVIGQSVNYYRGPRMSDPTHTVTINPVSVPSQVTSPSVGATGTAASGITTGVLTYEFDVPNDPEIYEVRVEMLICDNPASHGGAYVAAAGQDWNKVADLQIPFASIGGHFSWTQPHGWTWFDSDGWFQFRFGSHSRADVWNLTSRPTYNLHLPASSGLNLGQANTATVGGGLQVVGGALGAALASTGGLSIDGGGFIAVKTIGQGVSKDAYGNLLVAYGGITNPLIGALAVATANLQNSAVDATKIANLAVGTAHIQAAAITTALIANAAITDALIANCNVSKLLAGTAQFLGTATFQYSTTGPSVVISSGNITLTNGSYQVVIGATAISMYGPGTTQLSLSSTSITLKPNSGLDGVTINSDGSLTVTMGSYSTTVYGNSIGTGEVYAAVVKISPGDLVLGVSSIGGTIVWPWSQISTTASAGYLALPASCQGFVTVKAWDGSTMHSYKIPIYNT